MNREDLIKKLYPNGIGNMHSSYDEKKTGRRNRNAKARYNDRPVGSVYDNPGVDSDNHSGSGYFKNKRKKSFNPNFDNENRRKSDNRQEKQGNVRGRNRRNR